MTEKVLMTVNEVSALLGISRSMIYKLRQRGKFPEPLDIGSSALLWRRSDITEYFKI